MGVVYVRWRWFVDSSICWFCWSYIGSFKDQGAEQCIPVPLRSDFHERVLTQLAVAGMAASRSLRGGRVKKLVITS